MKLSKNIGALASAAVIVASLSACSTAGKLKDGVTDTAGGVLGGDDAATVAAEKKAELDSQAAALAARSADLDKRESLLAQQASASASAAASPAGTNYGAGDLLPPGAKPGQ